MKNLMIAALLLFGATGSATAAEGESLFGIDAASVTFGPYVRAELGYASPNPGDAFWHPPGASDPTIYFDADVDGAAVGALAFGYDWQNGYRGELAINLFGSADAPGTCAYASDGSPCSGHTDISQASVRTTAALLNVYYSPREARGDASRVQPFFTAGIGFANNRMSDWTRFNPSSSPTERTFAGASNSDLAWSIGAGVAFELERKSDWPVILEATYRYFDLGTARGGATPRPGSGGSEPIEPYQFKHRSHTVSLGLRIPLERY